MFQRGIMGNSTLLLAFQLLLRSSLHFNSSFQLSYGALQNLRILGNIIAAHSVHVLGLNGSAACISPRLQTIICPRHASNSLHAAPGFQVKRLQCLIKTKLDGETRVSKSQPPKDKTFQIIHCSLFLSFGLKAFADCIISSMCKM